MFLYKDKSWLIQKYSVEGLSRAGIARLAGVNRATILYWMKRHGVSRRSMKEIRLAKLGGVSDEAYRDLLNIVMDGEKVKLPEDGEAVSRRRRNEEFAKSRESLAEDLDYSVKDEMKKIQAICDEPTSKRRK